MLLLVYSISVTAVVFGTFLDHWMRRSTVKLDPKKDLIVITGGGSKRGIGHCMTLNFRARGFSVAIISKDVEWEANDHAIQFFIYDVRDPAELRKARAELLAAFPGKQPTVLINNAGIAHNKTALDMTEEKIRAVIDVNLLGAIWCTRTFLPDMREARRGYIVNIASVLGTVGVAQVSAYCASKFGLIGFHESLTHEVSNPYKYYAAKKVDISTLLVTPGHISTGLFEGLSMPSAFFTPVLTPQFVGDAIVDAVCNGETGTLRLPFFTRLTWVTRVIPGFIIEYFRMVAAMDKSMDSYVGNEMGQ